ncbi:beta-1 adrenergic receptor-like [Orbicella faveolata]|uniref:beta-1 adrenergic receptor-like n=1 Tax=Orbicella faveolata TaxID=48498 RepID=UPI0009E23A9F|nr:beta-1 adrenergic receptor-like [Orbicella faveolata]
MNCTAINITSASCGSLPYFPIPSAERLSPELRAVFIFKIAVNAISCPLVVLLNTLVMAAVKTNRRLRSKSNVSLACLATTDLIVGLVVQPLQIAHHSFVLKGETGIICSTLATIRVAVTTRCIITSLYHFVLLSAERYIAIKHSFAYENLVTEVRIIAASGLAWAAAMIVPAEDFWPPNIQYVAILAVVIMQFISIVLVVYFNVSVYREVRRNEKQIIANQVSVEVKEKLLKNKKAFYCTIIVLLTVFLCCFPANISTVILISLEESIAINVRNVIFHLLSLLPVLNSLFNPLIYAVRIRYFRVAFIQFLLRKTIVQAEQLERNIFGPKQVRVANVATAE